MPEKRTVFMWDKDGQKFSVPEEEADWALSEGGLSRAAPPNLGKAEGIRGPLTTMEKAILIAKDTLRTLPETAGMTIGGMAGGVMGGPPGAIAGGAGGGYLGTKVGQAARSMWPGVFGQPPATNAESVGEQFQNMAMGAASEAIPAGVGKFLGRAPSIPTATQRALTLAKNEGIPFTAGDVNPGGAVNMMENLAMGSMLGAKPMIRFGEMQARALEASTERMLNNAFGPIMGRVEAGNMAKAGVKAGSNYWFAPGQRFDRAYQALSVAYPEPINTSRIRDIAKRELDEVRSQLSEGRIAVVTPNRPSQYIASLEKAAKYGTVKDPNDPTQTLERTITYWDAWKDKQALDSMIDYEDPLVDRAKGMLVKLRQALDSAMEDAAEAHARRTGNPTLVRKIKAVNKAYGRMKDLFQKGSLVAEIENMDPEKVVQSFFPTGGITPSKDLFRAIPPDMRKVFRPKIQRRVAENLFTNLRQETSTAVGEVQIIDARKLKRYLHKNDETLTSWFDPEQKQALVDLANTAALAQSSRRLQNANSARQIYALWQILQLGETGKSILEGDFSNAGIEGAKFLTPQLMGYALTNPTIIRHLTKGFRVSPGTQEYVRWGTRLAAYYKMLDDQYQRDKKAEEQRRGTVQ